jgi:hypothetical protein
VSQAPPVCAVQIKVLGRRVGVLPGLIFMECQVSGQASLCFEKDGVDGAAR